MYSNFKAQAIEWVKEAVQEDNAGNYAKAFPLYMNALEYFKTHLKYEKNSKIREAITQKFTEYLRRAGEIRAVLDEGGGSGPVPDRNAEGGGSGPATDGDAEGGGSSPAPDGDAAVAAQPNATSKGGEKDGEDAEQAKGLNSAIIREKPNTMYRFFKEQAIEYVKEAVQEDNEGKYAKAFPLYMNAMEYFKTYLKYEKNPKMREAITQKFTEYLRRAEEIRAVLDGSGGFGSGGSGPAPGGDAKGGGSGPAPDDDAAVAVAECDV